MSSPSLHHSNTHTTIIISLQNNNNKPLVLFTNTSHGYTVTQTHLECFHGPPAIPCMLLIYTHMVTQ